MTTTATSPMSTSTTATTAVTPPAPPSKTKNPSPYVVLHQKNVHEMHSLVLELDNNLSFGSTRAGTSSSSGELKNVQMDTSDLHLCEKNLIGRGTYASVYKCQLHGTDVAVKAFNGERHTSEVVTSKTYTLYVTNEKKR